MSEVVVSPRPGFGAVVGAYISLMKPRVIELLLVTTLPAMVLAEHKLPSLRLALFTLVGGTLAAGSANALNCYLDRDIDALMKRTAMRPLTRSAGELTVSPRSAVVFGFINDLRRFQDWSPWAKLDPQCKVVFTGPPAGVGTAFAWEGNRKAGAGSMTCLASRPAEGLEFRLEFLRPMKATHTARFALQPEGGGTLVIWSMDGKNNFMGKAFGLVVDCDKMVGKDFEKGLASLKTLAEAAAKK